MEYEAVKEYEIRGVRVRSEVVKDEPLEGSDDRRAVIIRSSCESHRWGTRTEEFSLNTTSERTGFLKNLEQTRLRAAEILIKHETGELPEGGPGFLGVQISGPTGKVARMIAAADLGVPVTLLDADLIQFLALEATGKSLYQEVKGGVVSIPLYRAEIGPGDPVTDALVAPAELSSPPCVLGGDYFQKLLRGKEKLIHDLVMSDHYRAFVSAARCKKANVLVLGKYGEQRPRLERIKKAVGTVGFVGVILDEIPDIEEQPLAEKLVLSASVCRFVVVDDILPSGHIAELEVCRERQFVTAVLRPQGRASSYVQATITTELAFLREFSYPSDADLEGTVLSAVKWADEMVSERSRALNRQYATWRSKGRVMR